MQQRLLVQLQLLLGAGGVGGRGEVVRPQVGGGGAGGAVEERRAQRLWKGKDCFI